MAACECRRPEKNINYSRPWQNRPIPQSSNRLPLFSCPKYVFSTFLRTQEGCLYFWPKCSFAVALKAMHSIFFFRFFFLHQDHVKLLLNNWKGNSSRAEATPLIVVRKPPFHHKGRAHPLSPKWRERVSSTHLSKTNPSRSYSDTVKLV